MSCKVYLNSPKNYLNFVFLVKPEVVLNSNLRQVCFPNVLVIGLICSQKNMCLWHIHQRLPNRKSRCLLFYCSQRSFERSLPVKVVHFWGLQKHITILLAFMEKFRPLMMRSPIFSLIAEAGTTILVQTPAGLLR